MKAVRIHRFGGPEVLCYEDVPRPIPAAGEVLVRVYAAGVNPADWKTRSGRGVAGRLRDRLPITVTLKGVKADTPPLKGTVKASLELRGKLGDTDLDSVVRLRDTKSVEFAVQK